MFSPSLLVKLISNPVLNPPSLAMSFAGSVGRSRELPSRSSSVSALQLQEESQWKVERAIEERLALKQQAQLAAAECAPTQGASSVDQGAVPEATAKTHQTVVSGEMPEPDIEESLDCMLEQEPQGATPSAEEVRALVRSPNALSDPATSEQKAVVEANPSIGALESEEKMVANAAATSSELAEPMACEVKVAEPEESKELEEPLEPKSPVAVAAGDVSSDNGDGPADLDASPPVVTRQGQWSKKPKPARGRGRGRGRGGRKKTCGSEKDDAEDAEGPECVLDSDEEMNQEPPAKPARKPKAKAKSKAKAACKPASRPKAKGRANTKNAKGEAAESAGSIADAKEDKKNEIPIVWGPVVPEKVSHLFNSSGPSVCLQETQNKDLPSDPEQEDCEPKRKVPRCDAECDGGDSAPAAVPSGAGEEPEIPVVDAEEPPVKKKKRSLPGEGSSFARRPCPKTRPFKERWEVIREVYQKVVQEYVAIHSLPSAAFEVFWLAAFISFSSLC
jgi:hypothetical protein